MVSRRPRGQRRQVVNSWNRALLLSCCLMLIGVSSAQIDDMGSFSDETGPAVYSGRRLAAKEASSKCEFNVEYSITSVNKNEFEATLAVKSNRDVSNPLQIVYRLEDDDQKDLEYVTDAILVTRGNSTFGIPIRMKTFESSSPGETKKINSAIKFTSDPFSSTGLGIQGLNVNGIQCDPVLAKDKITYGTCANAISFFQSFNGRPPPINGGMDECSIGFCCGVVPIPVEAKKEIVLAPTPEREQMTPSSEYNNNATTSPIQQETVVVAPNNVTVDPNGQEAGSTEQSSGGGSSVVLIGAVVGVAAVLTIIVIISILCVRSRRKRTQISPEVDTKPSINPQRQPSSARPKTVSNIVAMSGSLMSRGGTVSSSGQGDLPTPIDTLPDDLPEDVILHEQLGAGAFGTVFRGEWGGHTVAVKVLQTAYSSNSRELDSFRQEIAVLSGLRHPNIIAFLAACTISPDVCIIEELAEGGSLHTRLHGPSGSDDRCRPLSIADAIQVAIDVAQAMKYLHPSIVHRDLKSQNVLLDSDGRAKVCDFGIAKFKDRTFVSTMNGQAGTPAYMAPELFDGVNATEKVDVYSYAILLWECITGKVPWGHVPSPMQIIYYVGVLNQRPPLPDSVPDPFKKLIQECWTVDPKDRPSFEEILNRLLDMKQMYGTSHIRLEASQTPLESEDDSSTGSSDDEQVANDEIQKKETKSVSLAASALTLETIGQCQTKSFPLTLDSGNGFD